MFKSFSGFHFVESIYHLGQKRRNSGAMLTQRMIKLIFAIVTSLVLWLLPADSFGIDGLTVIEQRTIAIFAFATLMWVLEAIPAWCTSVVVVVLLMFTPSRVKFTSLLLVLTLTVLVVATSAFD